MSFTDPPYIDIGARGAVSRVYAHIYTAIYRTANHPYTKVSDPGSPRITGSQGHRVTKATEPQNHRATESRRRKVTGSPSIQVAKNHGVTGSPEPHYHMVTGSLSHWVTGLWVICHTRLSPWLRSPGSPGSQGYPGCSRVTG
jgi:hypothetical protein